jgi:hypothetical protein
MKYTFQTDYYGKVEVDTLKSEAYFYHNDVCAEIQGDDTFTDPVRGNEFRLIRPMPGRSTKTAHLQVFMPTTIAAAEPE